MTRSVLGVSLQVLPASYVEAHRYDGAAVEHAKRDQLEYCAVQPRDVAIIHDVSRHKFLTAPQLRELWWPTASVQAADRRLLKLFRAGLLDRFRPYARRGTGSYAWTYYLGEAGHRLLQHAGLTPDGQRYRRRAVFDYGHVLHELQLNSWVLAYRRATGDDLLVWDGETLIGFPAGFRHDQRRLDDDWSAEGLRDPRARPVCPDAILEIAGDEPGDGSRTLLVEYDRTRRLDKNYEKFRRYDAFLNWWWHQSNLAHHQAPPFVLFICQDDEQRAIFLEAADRELTGHRWHPDVVPERHEYAGRQRILFTTEIDVHAGRLDAWRLPVFPDGHRARDAGVRRVHIAPLAAGGTIATAELEGKAA
jgi:hypothetical protein